MAARTPRAAFARAAAVALAGAAGAAALTRIPLPVHASGGQAGPAAQLLGLLSGGQFGTMTFGALGLAPYITASLAAQMLALLVPRWRRDGTASAEGQAALGARSRRWAAWAAGAMACGQMLLLAPAGSGALELAASAGALWAGAMIMIAAADWLGRHGVGSGTGLLISAGVLARLPDLAQAWAGAGDPAGKLIVIAAGAALWALCVAVAFAHRRLPVQYAGGARRSRQRMAARSYIALPVNASGAAPVIFAGMLLGLAGVALEAAGARDAAVALSPGSWLFIALEAALIIPGAFLYAAAIFNPAEQALALQRRGGFLPGIRPGRPTAERIDRTVSRLQAGGAGALIVIACAPAAVMQASGVPWGPGGTGMLIVAAWAAEALRARQAAWKAPKA